MIDRGILSALTIDLKLSQGQRQRGMGAFVRRLVGNAQA